MPSVQDISFINVSEGKRATQSSLSKWSHAQEATAATDPDFDRAFAFHTDRQGAPHWTLDLAAVYPIEKIVLRNRRDGFQHRIGTLVVETSLNARDWTIVHSGLTYAKDEVTFPLSGMVTARFVRLRLQEATYLHLSQVDVIARRYDTFGEKVFLARRNDGLGERLNAILNALWLSEIYGCGFRFTWSKRFQDDPLHAIVPVEDMFSAEFIDRYFVPESDVAGNWEIVGPERSYEEIAWRLSDTGMVSAPRVHLSELMKTFIGMDDREGLKRAFARIGFSDHVRAAIDLAYDVEIAPDASALHLRSGDVFFGEYRKLLHYTYKGITLPIAKNIILNQQEKGRCVYIFGQDNEAIAYLSAETSAVDTNTINQRELEGMSRVQKAMYDLVLLSRFRTIVGGSSGFSRQAGWIGGSDVFRPPQIFNADTQHALSVMDLAENKDVYHPLQTAFAYWYAYFYGREKRTPEENIPLLQDARRFDPANELYFFVEAALLMKCEDGPAASDLLSKLMQERHAQDSLTTVFDIFVAHTAGKPNLAEYLPHFEKLAKDGSFHASALMCALARKRKDAPAVQVYNDLCSKASGVAPELKDSVIQCVAAIE